MRQRIHLLLELLYGECDERMRQENKVLDVVVFEGSDVLAEFGVVSISCFEDILCESDVRFCCVVVYACNGGLVNY